MEANRNCSRGSQGRCYYNNQGTTVKYTNQAGGCRPAKDEHKTCPEDSRRRPVGMTYIPEQPFENLYDAKCGLQEGTMFKDLNLIFCGVRGKQSRTK